VTSGKLGIHQDHPHRRIEMKFCMVGDVQDVIRISSRSIKRVRSCVVEFCPSPWIWPLAYT